MKKGILAKLAVVLLIGFMLGGAVVAKNLGYPLKTALLGDAKSPVTNSAQAASSGPLDVASIAKKAGPAVVSIETKTKVTSSNDPFSSDPFFRQFFGGGNSQSPQYETGLGTGFIISKDGYIVTNQHVIDNATEVKVKVVGQDNAVSATVVGQDYELDLAVLKISGTNYPTLAMGNSDQMQVGEWVVAIGQPYGLDHTVTAGVISAKGRPITIEDRNYKNLIQTDAAINPGNSGGPLINMSGQVIAINTAVNAQAQGIGFAIPINTAKDVLNQLIENGKVIRPYMGVSMLDMTADIASRLGVSSSTKGAVVADVVAGSPADTAGLRSADIISKIDSTTITSSSDVQNFIKDKHVGNKITVQVLRDGKKVSVQVTLKEKP
ncbi:MAG: S1C family serine protease [Methylocystaceae bacterium]